MKHRIETVGTEPGMCAGPAVIVYVGLLTLIEVEFVRLAPWILVVGKSAAKMAVVAERFGLRLSATAQPDRCLCRDRDPEMVDQRNGTIELVRTIADDDDTRCGLAPFVNRVVLNQAVLNRAVLRHVVSCSTL